MTTKSLLNGNRYGRLIAISPIQQRPKRRAWLCKCDCGNEAIVLTALLTRGSTKSCGCIRKETCGNMSRTHGKSKDKTYKIWSKMIQRCTNPKVERYSNYGGRGITVCDQWKTFDGFYADMGNAEEGYSLERIDVNGNYEKSNCSWIKQELQSKNTTRTVNITLNGITKNAKDWSIELGMRASTIYYRVAKGLPPEMILRA